MNHQHFRFFLFIAVLFGAASCAGTGSGGVVSETLSNDLNCGDGAGARVTVGFYETSACEAGEEVATLTYDTSVACYGWTRNTSGGGTRDNSVTRMACYRDRVCFTQHVETLSCDKSTATDKESRTDACLREPTGQDLWSKILSGTEECPAAPSGFECPVSGTQEGSNERGFMCGTP